MHAFLQCTQRGRAVFHMTAASLIGNEFALTIDCLNLFKQDARKIGKKKKPSSDSFPKRTVIYTKCYVNEFKRKKKEKRERENTTETPILIRNWLEIDELGQAGSYSNKTA